MLWLIRIHWLTVTLISGRSRGTHPARTPPKGTDSFVFDIQMLQNVAGVRSWCPPAPPRKPWIMDHNFFALPYAILPKRKTCKWGVIAKIELNCTPKSCISYICTIFLSIMVYGFGRVHTSSWGSWNEIYSFGLFTQSVGVSISICGNANAQRGTTPIHLQRKRCC